MERDQSFQVFVRLSNGKTVSLDVRPQDAVRLVKEQLVKLRPGCSKAVDIRLIHGGFELQDQQPLFHYGMEIGATLHEMGCLLGGGGDGGTTAIQRKFLTQAAQKKKEEIIDLSDEQRAKWEMCAASGAPLNEPIVCCELGYLYNKEALLQQMATKTTHANFKHVRRLKDVVSLKLHVNPDYSESKGAQTRLDMGNATAKFICPITLKPANGKYPFVAIRTCGHVLSEQAVREITSDGKCPVCGTHFLKSTDLITLNSSAEILAQRRQQLEARRSEDSKKRVRTDGEATTESASSKKEPSGKLTKTDSANKNVASIHSSLTNSVTKSATLGTAAHAKKAKTDPIYASMFKPKDSKDYDAAWGQGAMAGVLGSR